MIRLQLRAFTLVELLVVITIIGILAALITVAAIGALKKARETESKAEINQLADALELFKTKHVGYPPSGQNDGIPQTEMPLDDNKAFQDLKRHMKQAFPRHQESDDLLKVLNEIVPQRSDDYPKLLNGGICADEALAFWLGGFSSDPKYPISGKDGPSYLIPKFGDSQNREMDPIESRKWLYPFDVSRLGPRADDGYFDDSVGAHRRYIEYRDPRGITRRVNFWTYSPRKSQQPYLYFDASRNPAAIVENGEIVSRYDPPARPLRAGGLLAVYAFKKANPIAGSLVPIEFMNSSKFQIIHCGIDDRWDEESFQRMRAHGVKEAGKDPRKLENYLLFPDGPFTGEIADSVVNFTAETRIEDSQR